MRSSVPRMQHRFWVPQVLKGGVEGVLRYMGLDVPENGLQAVAVENVAGLEQGAQRLRMAGAQVPGGVVGGQQDQPPDAWSRRAAWRTLFPPMLWPARKMAFGSTQYCWQNAGLRICS